MAKLSARGRTELARFERSKDIKEWLDYGSGYYDSLGEWIYESYNPPRVRSEVRPSDVVKEKLTYALMSDGHLLHKLHCTWHDGQVHDYGWKDKGKYKLTLEDFINKRVAGGYTRIK